MASIIGLSHSVSRHRRAETVREIPTFARSLADETRQELIDCVATIESILEGPASSALTSRQYAEIKALRSKVNRAAKPNQNLYNSMRTFIPSEVMADLNENPQSAFIATTFGGVELTNKGLRKGFRIKSTEKKSKPNAGLGLYVPPEWENLSKESQKKLAGMLSWESLSKWGLDLLEVAKLSLGTDDGETAKKSCPLLLLGWAILGSPHSQRGMQASIRGPTSSEATNSKFGYNFMQKFGTNPETLCSFLRTIEKNYKDNPFHNSTHAADVLQTTHVLLQYAGDDLSDLCTPLDYYSTLLAAAVHDIGHPGTNNSFQIHAKTDVAIRYNDRSVLENMHASKAFQLLMGSTRKPELDVLKELSPDEAKTARQTVIDAVLGIDMSQHFSSLAHVEKILRSIEAPLNGEDGGGEGGTGDNDDGLVIQRLGQVKDSEKVVGEVLRLVLHLADISNPAKPLPICTQWGDRALREFFSQGDREKELGLPISPLCDRETTDRAESQIGFIIFVVRPAYELLSKIIPRVSEDILPVINENLQYWERQKKLS